MITNAQIQMVRRLAVDKTERELHRLFVVEGRKSVAEAVASSLTVENLYVAPSAAEWASGMGAEFESIAERQMERMSAFKTPSDVLAVVRMPERRMERGALLSGLHLALDSVQDPGNLGTIIRLADWFGIDSIIASPETADCYNPKVVQATMGALLRMKIFYGDLTVWLGAAREEGVAIYGTFLGGENIYSSPLSASGIIVMGNEGNGISESVERTVTRKLFIPPYCAEQNMCESLNVATAAAIVCSEFRRR